MTPPIVRRALVALVACSLVLARAAAAKTTGDFVHAPAAEQAEHTPLPIYVETAVSGVASVVVKYEAPGMTSFVRVPLERTGKGWGGYVPCDRIVSGDVRYFVQGFDAQGEPVANSGDPKHPFVVPIHTSISGAPPSLPGAPPPARCGEGEPAAPPTPVVAPPPANEAGAPVGPPAFAHLWIGVAAGLPFTFLQGAPGVCKLANGLPITTPSYYCTTPDGQDFPARASGAENDTLAGGGADGAGTVGGGPTIASQRVMLTIDYAFTASLLVGARVGYVIGGYPGQAAANDGRAFTVPIHAELRATYLFGDAPLARTGFAPLVFLGGGVSSLDANEVVLVSQSGIAGQRPIRAWRTGGPGMADLGGGLRYAFSQRVATTLALEVMGFFGGSGIVPGAGPELGVAVGF